MRKGIGLVIGAVVVYVVFFGKVIELAASVGLL
jgi:hypothetical protein